MKNLGTVVAVVAVILGIVGIVSGMSAKKASDELKLQMESIQTRADGATAEASRLQGELVNYSKQVGAALTSLDSKINSVQQQLTKPPPPAVDDKKGVSGVKGKDTGEKVAGRGGEHAIAAGETFEKLAKKYGVTSQALIDANPSVRPERLKIGQKVRIP